MKRTIAMLLFVGVIAMLAHAQGSSRFEVASIKPVDRPVPIGPVSPNRWQSGSLTLIQLIGRAYPQYAFGNLVVGGPPWARQLRFAVDAKIDAPTTPAQLAQMISNLLIDRFALRSHAEQRQVDVYLLKTLRDDGQVGPGLRRSNPLCVEARTARQSLPSECLPTGKVGLEARAMQVNEFLRSLYALGIDRPVLDRTGLTGYFDWRVDFQNGPFSRIPEATRPDANEGLSIFTALREQAGLKLEAARELVDVLVIDSATMPTSD
jgi:uncharacterized protein (TIGR03435 family)